MKTNETHDKNQTLSTRPIRSIIKSLKNQASTIKEDIKNDTSRTPLNKTIINGIVESPVIQITADNHSKEVKQSWTGNNTKKDDDSLNTLKQNQEIKENQKHSEQPRSSIYSRYQLNFRNYITELYKALMKECQDNLEDNNTLNVTLDFETMSDVTYRTLKAIKNQKIFSVLGYFPKISEELKTRGWVEKRDPFRPPINYSYYSKSTPNAVNWMESPPVISSPNDRTDPLWERLKTAHSWSILKDKRSDLIFVTRKRLVNWSNLHDLTIVSQMARHAFCSKNGLAQCLERYKNTVSNLMFPRCYYVRGNAGYNLFMEDYITTALTSTLKIIVQSIEENKMMLSENGQLPYKMIDFVKRCILKFLNKQQTGCTDTDTWKFESQKEVWNEFFINYMRLIIDDNATFHHDYSYQLELDIYARCKYLLDNVKKYCPQYYIDGNTNTWIIKPTSNCSGHGIILTRDLNKIKEKCSLTEDLRSNYILQKYIEKPLLVFSCKIDLRQWFLVTNMNPIAVWMYKEGYVRFCASGFTMKNTHESIHLSNVRLQMKYRKLRGLNVPEECMWDYKELQNHLATIGQEHVWDELIFPGMSESVYAVIQAAADNSFYRAKSFQLFGADFLITENFIPYLIEINSIPGLNPSTSVIANLAPMLLADIVKVVVDYERNANADTGLFVKVVPENLKPAAAVPTGTTAAVPRTDARRFSPPEPELHGGTGYRDRGKWPGNVNDGLTARRLHQTDVGQTAAGRYYLSHNRDHLLSAANATVQSADVDVVKCPNDGPDPARWKTATGDLLSFRKNDGNGGGGRNKSQVRPNAKRKR